MKKFFVVLFIVVFAVIISMSAFAEESNQIQSVTGIVKNTVVKTVGGGRAIGSTLIKFKDGREIDFDGIYPYIVFEEDKEVKIVYQYSEERGARGFIILAVEYQ